MHNLNSPVHSNFSMYSPNSKIVIFEIVERYIPELLNYDFSVFDDYMDDFESNLSKNTLDLNSGVFNNVAKFTDISPFRFSSLSEDSYITWNTNIKTLDYIYLDLNNLDEYKIITLYWAKENEDFTDESSIDILLKPGKCKYQIPVVNNNTNIDKIRLAFNNKPNVDLNINSIDLYTKNN